LSINPDNELLKHMLDETTFILNHTENLTREDLSLVGLALPHAVRKDRPVEKIAGTQDKLIHDYYGIDYDIVWDILTSKIQELHQFLKSIGE